MADYRTAKEIESEAIFCEHCGALIEDGEAIEVNGAYGVERWCPHCVENDAKECYECGELFNIDLLEKADTGDYYCTDCACELVRCEDCGALIASNDYEEVHCGRYKEFWCSDCVSERAWCCEDCSEYFSSEYESGTYIRHHGTICGACYDWGDYHYCENCDDYVCSSDYNYDCECCNNCYEREGAGYISGYHGGPELEYFGDPELTHRGIWRGLGIELEIDNGHRNGDLARVLNDMLGEHAYFERDSSLESGFEIITQPHTIREFFKLPWQRVLNIIKEYGYQSHDASTCGLHVHISRTMFGSTTKTQRTTLKKVLYFYDEHWHDILALSRRTEAQADRWAKRYCVEGRGETIDGITSQCSKSLDHIAKNGHRMGRYFAINLCNTSTIEFRLGRGTLRYESFIAWVDFTLTLVNNARHIRWHEVGDLTKWLKGLDANTIEYIRCRNAFGGAL